MKRKNAIYCTKRSLPKVTNALEVLGNANLRLNGHIDYVISKAVKIWNSILWNDLINEVSGQTSSIKNEYADYIVQQRVKEPIIGSVPKLGISWSTLLETQ